LVTLYQDWFCLKICVWVIKSSFCVGLKIRICTLSFTLKLLLDWNNSQNQFRNLFKASFSDIHSNIYQNNICRAFFVTKFVTKEDRNCDLTNAVFL
jgi:hypothetical protein